MSLENFSASDIKSLKRSCYKLNNRGLNVLTLFFAAVVVLLIDFSIDFNITTYFVFLVITFYLFRLIYRKRFFKRFIRRAKKLDPENLNFFYDKLRISDKDGIISFEIEACQMNLNDDFLFLRTPLIILDKQIASKSFILQADTHELKEKYLSIIEEYQLKNRRRKKLFTWIFIAATVLMVAWKIDLYILNKVFYANELSWQVVRVEENNVTIFDKMTDSTIYIRLKNNFSADSIPLSASRYLLFHYRHEPFFGVNILFV